MGIGNIRYAMPNITAADTGQVRRMQEAAAPAAVKEQKPDSVPDIALEEPIREPERVRQSKPVDPTEVSLTFNKNEEFEYLGSESDLLSLDMHKAISDMKRDGLLRQYQYFVGSSEALVDNGQNEDGAVFLKN